MFCSNCGQGLAIAATGSGGCNTAVAMTSKSSQEFTKKVRVASTDALAAFRTFGANPVGGLSGAFESLGKRHARDVGIVFGIVFDVCVLLSGGQLLSRMGLLDGEYVNLLGYIKLLLIGAVPFGSLVAAGYLASLVFRGSATWQGSTFIAGACLLPFGLFMAATAIVGVANLEIVAILGLVALCYTILILYSGCRTILEIPEGTAALSVPLVILASVWLTKVVLAVLLF